MNIQVIWNDAPYSAVLASAFGEGHVITGMDEFNAKVKQVRMADGLIVLCELTWEVGGVRSNRPDLYGIELIKQLRVTYDLEMPVLFVSFCALSRIFLPETEILTAIGHSFCRLPARTDQLEARITNDFAEDGYLRKLSRMELDDIKSFYCSKEGILSHELHALNRYLNFGTGPDDLQTIWAGLLEAIRSISRLFRLDPSPEIHRFEETFVSIHKGTVPQAIHYITDYGARLRKQYTKRLAGNGEMPAEVGESAAPGGGAYPWKVLLLDDEIGEDHGLIRVMKDKGIDVLCAQTAEDALVLFQEDLRTTGAIMVVIADYRLYEKIDGIRHHQKIQGYRFLQTIANSDHLVRLVAFSGLERKFLLGSFQYYNIRTEIKSKTDYLTDEHTFRLFAEEIIEMAEENRNAIESLPSRCAGFAKYLEKAYREFRAHPEYNRMERDISVSATHIIRAMEESIRSGAAISINPIAYIKSPLARTKKGPGQPFSRLEHYLIARRVALWLFAFSKKGSCPPLDTRRIAEILTGQSYPTDAYRQVISTNLGLSLEDFPGNITIEEKRWLQYEAGMNVFRDIGTIDSLFKRVRKHFAAYIQKNEALAERIRRQDLSLVLEYKNVGYKIAFEPDLSPMLKTATDIRVLYLIMKNEAKISAHAG